MPLVMNEAAVHKELDKEQAELNKKNGGAIHPTSADKFLVMGLQLEVSQYVYSVTRLIKSNTNTHK